MSSDSIGIAVQSPCFIRTGDTFYVVMLTSLKKILLNREIKGSAKVNLRDFGPILFHGVGAVSKPIQNYLEQTYRLKVA